MATSRTWNLRLNLDEFNALVASLYTDSDRALMVQGMSLGVNGGTMPESAPESFRRGWEMGCGMREEAERFRGCQSERGRSSAAKRLERTGSAQPSKKQESRTKPEPPFEPPFEPAFEPAVEPNHNPQSYNVKTAINTPPTPQRGKVPRFSAEMFDDLIPPTLTGSSEFVTMWHKWIDARKERRKPVTQTAADEQLQMLASFGIPNAILSIRQSITNDWQGLFAPKQARPAFRSRPSEARAATDHALIDQLAEQDARHAKNQSAQLAPAEDQSKWISDFLGTKAANG